MAKAKQLQRLKKTLRQLPGAGSLRLQPYSASTGTGTRVAIPGVCDNVLLRLEDGGPRWSRLPTHLDLVPSDVETGDDAFDRDFHLVGSPALVLALLNAETRRALVGFRWGPVRLSDLWLTAGKLWVDVPDSGGSAEAHLAAVEQVTRLALEVAPLLRRPTDIPQRLAENATREALPFVRLRNLSELVRDYPDHALTCSTLERAARDSDPEVRLRAGIDLQADGEATLAALAADGRVPDSTSARAVEALGARLATARASDILWEALGGRTGVPAERPLTAGACIELMVQRSEAAALGPALWVAGTVGLAAVEALERIGGPVAEQALITALEVTGGEQAAEIARALGVVGSVVAVESLEKVAQRGGKLKRAARQAIAAIQARTAGTPGQLSLAEGDRGGLTLTEDQAGQLSLAERKSDPARPPGSRPVR